MNNIFVYFESIEFMPLYIVIMCIVFLITVQYNALEPPVLW